MQSIVTTSWDDGDALDLKLAELLSEFGIAATFYIAPRNRLAQPLPAAEVRQLDEHFEIGGHSLTHADLTAVEPEQVSAEVETGKHELEDTLGHAVTAFSYPFGRCNRRVRRAVREAGFASARTTRVLRTAPAGDPLLAPTSIRAYPHGRGFWLLHCVRTAYARGVVDVLGPHGSGWVEMGLRLFDRVTQRGGVWHLWGHARDLEEMGLWDDLRRLLARVAGQQRVRYLPNSAALTGLGGPPPQKPNR